MSSKSLGFADLKNIKPDIIDETNKITDHEIDKIGEKHGFTARETEGRIYKRKNTGATVPLSMRLPTEYYNRYVQYSKDKRYSYPELLMLLMDEKGI